MTMTPEQLRIADRITAYLSGGGLFNPELANHDAVRDLLIDARDELHMLRLHIADKNATITAMGATHEKLAARVRELEGELVEQRDNKDGAYLERNRLVALLASMFPSGIKRTAIEGWSADWNGCVYIDFPWGQASWHYHDSHAFLFDHLPPYQGSWDGHTTEQKYAAIAARSK